MKSVSAHDAASNRCGTSPVAYQDGVRVYHANTCDPLKAAVRRGDLAMGALSHGTYPGMPLPATLLPELCSVGYWDAEHDQNWGLDWHRNEGLELTFLARGKVAFSVEGRRETQLSAGDLTITRPWQEHRVGNPDVTASRLYWVILDLGVRQPHSAWQWPDWLVLSADDLQDLNRLLQLNEDPVIRSDSAVGDCMQRIGRLTDGGDPESQESRLKLYLNELFICLLDLLREARRPMDEALIQARRTVQLFIDALPNHLNVPWTLASMAQECELGRTQFSHYFKLLTNQTPLDYLKDLRIAASENWLTETDATIAQIARRCGFSSSQYFATQFKRRHRMPPGRFRQTHATSP